MKTGVELITEERARQVSQEGWTSEHDDEHSEGEIAEAAACYASLASEQAGGGGLALVPPVPAAWPWDESWWKPRDQLRNLVRAGAMIAAEIDRMQRCHALMAELEADAGGYGHSQGKLP